MTNPADLHEGTPVRMGGRDFIVPALSMAQVEFYEMDGKLACAFEVGPLSPPEDRMLAMEIILAAMQRNYPTMTLNELKELLDLRSTPKVFLAVMGMSGLISKAGDPEGEPGAGA